MKRLIYVYDALCGWCFGFSPVMLQVARRYPEVPIEVISGGLVLGERVGPIGEVAPYIKKAYKDVENATGVTFGNKFVQGGLADGSLQMNSLPPAIALAIFREQLPARQLEFAHALHDLVYVEGNSPADIEALTRAAAKFRLDHETFKTRMKDEHYEDLARRDFMYAQQLRITGFPGLLAEAVDDQLYLVARGYTPLEPLLERLEKVHQTPG